MHRISISIFNFLWKWCDKTAGGIGVIMALVSRAFDHPLGLAATGFVALCLCAVVQGIKLWRLENPAKPFGLEIHEESTKDINKFGANDGIRAFYLKIVNNSTALAENVRISLSSDNPEIPRNYCLKTKEGADKAEINPSGFELFPLVCVKQEDDLAGGHFYLARFAPFTLASCNEKMLKSSDHYTIESSQIVLSITSKTGHGEFKVPLYLPKEDGNLADVSLQIT